MYTLEQRQKAVETFVRFGHSYADTIAELGYPTRTALRNWWLEFAEHGEVLPSKREREPRYAEEQKRAAVDYYLGHGRSLARTMRAMGYPSHEVLASWVDELAPGERKRRLGPCREPLSLGEKVLVVAELEARDGTAAEVAGRHGVSKTSPYAWRRELLGAHNGVDGDAGHERRPVSEEYDRLPDDVDELREMADGLRTEVRRLQLELDVREATLEIVKKDPGTDPNRLTNKEKATLVTMLRGRWKLRDLLAAVSMAKSSYEYAARALERPEGAALMAERGAIASSFSLSGGTYGYRRVMADVNADPDAPDVGEWTVRRVMREDGLVATNPRERRHYSSYAGEVSEAPKNTCRDEDGTHDFSAGAPNELWITDVTEFRVPAGKAYLSPVIDCFDGMPIGWAISTSPDAEMANSSLREACSQLGEGERPRVHSDRGGHYRWPGWISICEEHGLVRSMSRKGCSPDNSRAEGFFGRLKVEFFYGRDWQDVSVEEFMGMLDAYLRWYRDERRKSDLGYMSPMQYRKELGLAA